MTGSGSYTGCFISRVQLMSCISRVQIVQLIAFLNEALMIRRSARICLESIGAVARHFSGPILCLTVCDPGS